MIKKILTLIVSLSLSINCGFSLSGITDLDDIPQYNVSLAVFEPLKDIISYKEFDPNNKEDKNDTIVNLLKKPKLLAELVDLKKVKFFKNRKIAFYITKDNEHIKIAETKIDILIDSVLVFSDIKVGIEEPLGYDLETHQVLNNFVILLSTIGFLTEEKIIDKTSYKLFIDKNKFKAIYTTNKEEGASVVLRNALSKNTTERDFAQTLFELTNGNTANKPPISSIKSLSDENSIKLKRILQKFQDLAEREKIKFKKKKKACKYKC